MKNLLYAVFLTGSIPCTPYIYFFYTLKSKESAGIADLAEVNCIIGKAVRKVMTWRYIYLNSTLYR